MPAENLEVLVELERQARQPVRLREDGKWKIRDRTLPNVLAMLDIHELWHEGRRR